ncbi:MAG: globin [Planctomycetota bacterium]
MDEQPGVTVFEVIGEEGFARLTAAFYRRVKGDDVLGPMYPADDWNGAEKRLRDFLVFRFGGPTRYLEERGHPRLRMRHLPFAIDDRAAARWLSHMDAALAEAEIPGEVVDVLRPFFVGTAGHMKNR